MRKLFRFAGSVLALVTSAAILFGAAVFIYNRHIADYEYRLVAWPPKSEFDKPVEWQTKYSGRARILAIQGGSLFGLADLEVLKAIEEKSGKQIYELFDFLAGSSTGAVISTLLLFPQDAVGRPMSASDAIKAYEDFAGQVLDVPIYHTVLTGNGFFGPALRNRGRILAAKKIFRDGKFNNLLRPAMLPAFSQKRGGLTLFRNWDANQSNLYLAALVTAVTSAPTFFPAVVLSGEGLNGEFISDPALILNSPGEIAYLHARAHLPDVQKYVVVSLGTRRELNIPQQVGVYGGVLDWISPLLSMVYRGESSVSTHALERHQKFDSTIDLTPIVLAPELPLESSGFDGSVENVRAIRQSGRDFVRDHQHQLDDLILLLTGSDAKAGRVTSGW